MGKKQENKKKSLVPWRRPLSEVMPFEREIEHMFEDFFRRPLSRFRYGLGWPRRPWPWEDLEFEGPDAEVFEEKDDMVVRAELPGMKKEDIDNNIQMNACLPFIRVILTI